MRVRTWTVGVDFGATNIKLGFVTAKGRVAGETVLATRDHHTPSRFVRGLSEAIDQLSAHLRLRRHSLGGVGVGAPGLIDGRRGIIHRLVNVPGGWAHVPLRRLLEVRFRCPCAVDNDVNVVALGEWRFGAGQGTRESVYVTLGTGVGGGLVIGGRLLRGAAGTAGEIGHMTIAPKGPRCACGNSGCLEAFIGSASILRQARAAIRGGSRILRALARRHKGGLTPELISQAAHQGDRSAAAIWEAVGRALGCGLASVINLLNPERIVIGGGMAKAWPFFAPSLMATIRTRAFEVPARACRVVRATLGDRAGIVGGAILVWEQQRRGAGSKNG